MFFTRIQIPEDSPLWDILIIVSSLVVGFIILMSLSAGDVAVFPHLLDIPIILYAYRYPRWGIWFAGVVSAVYLISYAVIIPQTFLAISPAFGRVLIFMVIGTTVSILSNRLKNSENTYRNLFDNLSNAAYSVKINPDHTLGPFMDVNEMMCSAIGYPRDELIAVNPADILPVSYIRELKTRMEGHSQDVYGEFESFHLARDGREIPVEVKVHLFEIESGPIILATATDMTERYNRDRILKGQRDVALSLNHVRDGEEAVRLVIAFALEISKLDAGAFYRAEEDGMTFSSLYSTGFSGAFLRKNGMIRLPTDEITANERVHPVYGSAGDLVHSGLINGTSENQKMIGILPVVGNRGVLGVFILSSYGTSGIPDTERRLIEAIVAQVGATLDRLNIVRALRQSREDLRSLVDSMDGFQALAGPDGAIIAANRSFAAASGMKHEDIGGKNIIDFIQRTGEFKKYWQDSFADVLENGHSVRFEDEGEKNWYDTTLYPVFGSDGSVRAVGMLSTDISALKEAEKGLLEAERQYRMVIEALNIGVFDLEYFNQKLAVSPEWYTMLGYRGDMPDNMYSFWKSHIHPDEKDGVMEVIEETRNPKDDYYNEYRMQTGDGTWRWIKSHGKVIRWLPDGSPERIIGTHSDITRRKHAERALERTTRLLRDAQKIARLGYCEFDMENDLVLPDAGVYEILNISDEEPVFTFHEFCEFIHPDDRWQIEREIQNAGRENHAYSNIFRMNARGGFEIWVKVWIEPFVDKNGDESMIFGAMQDITDVRQTEEELIRTQIAVETSPDGVIFIDSYGDVIYGNQQAANAYGTDGVLIGLNVIDIDSMYSLEKWRQHWTDLREKKYLVYESVHHKSDGSVYPVEVIENYVKVGNQAFSCAYCHDITDRRKVENTLRESEQRLSLAVEGADLGIWDWNLKSDHLAFDDCFASIFGFITADMEMVSFSLMISLIHPNDRASFRHNLDDYFTNKGAPFLAEYRVLHRDGIWRWVRARGLIVSEDSEGNPLRMIGTIMDITEQQMAMDALAEQGEQLRETQDLARVAGWVHYIPENHLDFDHRILTILGYDEVGLPKSMDEFYQKFVYPDDRAEVEETYERHLQEYLPFDMVFRIIRPGGGIYYLHSRCQTIYNADGEPQKSVGIIQDVTEIREAENELREREWKVNEAQRVTHIRYWECDRSFITCSLNDDRSLIDLSFLERVGMRIHPDDYGWVAAKFYESVESRRDFSEEFRAVLEEIDDVQYLYCRGSHYYHSNGTYHRSLGTIMDITERIQTVNALRESEKKFRLVAENPSIGTYIIQDGRFVYVNDTCARFFGYLIEEMIGVHASEIIAPENGEKICDPFVEWIESGNGEIHIEAQGYTRTGLIFPIEIFGSVGEYGSQPAIIGTIIDITERKAYEEMLTLTRLTVEQATIGVGWIDQKGEFIYINGRGVKMLRYPKETLIGMNIQEISPHPNVEWWSRFWDELRTGGNRRFETIQVRGDGTSFPANFMVDYVSLDEIEFACIFVTDISRRREAEVALQQSLSEKTTLLQEVHHRVKNNLALISSMIQMQMRTLGDEQAAASLTETANRIISMALVHESIYRSRNITTIDAHEHLAALVFEIVPNLSAGKDIEVEVDAHGCTLDLNSGILYSLVVNELITNSIKYAFKERDKGKISITMECDEDRKVLRITDDGIGIPEDVDPFSQPSLGMNIVHSVVTDQLGGTIELVRGKGTTWVLTFPMKKE